MTDPSSEFDWPGLVRSVSERFQQLDAEMTERFEAFLDSGRELLNCSESAILVSGGDGAHMRFLASVNSRENLFPVLREIQVPISGSIVGCVFTTGQLIAIANPEDFYQGVDDKTGLQTRIYLAVPVIDGDETLGVLTFINRPDGEPENPFNETEIDRSLRLAEVAAAQLRFYNRLELQQRLFQDELNRIGNSLAAGGYDEQLSQYLWVQPTEDDTPPLARAIRLLEGLSSREQELAVALLSVLQQHGRESGGLGGDLTI